MRQKAFVLDTNGSIASVKVLRSTMCEGCAHRDKGSSCACGELLGANRVMIAEAVNDIGANVGDTVEIETETHVVLGYAALVFMLPLAVFFLLYAAADAVFPGTYISWIIGAGGFLLSFVPIFIADRRRRGKTPQLRITAVCVSEQKIHNENDEDRCER